MIRNESLLKRTTSRCPVCQAGAPAEVWKISEALSDVGRVVMRRKCAAHGETEAVIASDARFYWLAHGKPENQCCGGACSAGAGGVDGTLGRNALVSEPSDIERMSTCLALIEVVNSCNLACPTCYADSPHTRAVDAVPLEDLQRRIDGVIARKGPIEILQLSGGEPTLHPRFFDLLAWTMQHPHIGYVLLNTNGVLIANDDSFLAGLAATSRRGKFQLYLQFDGPQEAGQRALRGADLRSIREKVVSRCAAHGIAITLAMTVNAATLPYVWDTVVFGMQFENVRGVSFQPEFSSGRGPASHEADSLRSASSGSMLRLTTADILLTLISKSSGKLAVEDFTPLPCGDPNCATIGYLLRTPAGLRSMREFVDFAAVQGFLRDKVRYSPADLERCGCENEPLAELLKQWELDERHAFRLFVKPFMDAWTWDQDRIDRCCTHVIRPDGKLDSFCRYYANVS